MKEAEEGRKLLRWRKGTLRCETSVYKVPASGLRLRL